MRSRIITIFVILWLAVFNYESARYFFLEPAFKTRLPKIPFLFPPAGWIMFFQVSDRSGHAEVYGIKNNRPYLLDPHEIIKTRFIGFDMVHRNVLGTVLDSRLREPFCASLKRQFPEFEGFTVVAVQYPSLTASRYEYERGVMYECSR